MSELTQARRRIKRLEKCLLDVVRLINEGEDVIDRFTVPDEEDPTHNMTQAVRNRIARTLPGPW